MNQQLLNLKSSLNRQVISKFDIQDLKRYAFVPIELKSGTVFAVISQDSNRDSVSQKIKDVINAAAKYYVVSAEEFNEFFSSVQTSFQTPKAGNNIHSALTINHEPGKRKRLGEILVENGIITDIQLIEALAESKKMTAPLGSTLYSLGFITLDQLKDVLSKQYSIEVATVDMMKEQEKFINLLPEDFIKTNRVIPISSDGKIVKLGMVNPEDSNVLKDIVYLTGQKPKPYLMPYVEFQAAINKFFSESKQETKKILKELEDDALEIDGEESIWEQIDKELQDSSGSVAKFVNKIITDAIDTHASDIHIEPRLTKHIVRYRIDGILREVMEIPPKVEMAVVTRFKVLSRMNIAEHRRPQDGSFSIKYKGKTFDFRINSLPVGGKEKMVIRVLAPAVTFEAKSADIQIEGASKDELEIIKKMIASPNGIILTSGPTGSGKTTTLFALLRVLNSSEVNITTIEDPVEIRLEGINQSQVNAKAGITFAFCMRAILRQDPDIILVGEIRDYETLEVAISAALTGHLVLSTVHTNSAAATVTRLIEMGAKDYLVATTLTGVIAQRLVRKLCKCKQEYYPTHEEAAKILSDESEIQRLMQTKLYKPVGCDECNMTGYKGRLAVLEVLTVTKEIKKLVSQGAHDIEIEDAAVACGMKTLYKSCLVHVLAGLTTIDEQVRVLGLINE